MRIERERENNTSEQGPPPSQGGNQPEHGGACDGSEVHLTEATHDSLQWLQSSFVLPEGWSEHSPSSLNKSLLCRISEEASSSSVLLQLTQRVKVDRHMSWSLSVNQHPVDITESGCLSSYPLTINAEALSNTLSICIGQPNLHLVKVVFAKKGKVSSPDGRIVAYVDGGETVRM